MRTNMQGKFFSEQEALEVLLRETSKKTELIDMELVNECLYYLTPENEDEDREFIERTLPVLHQKLGLDKSVQTTRRKKPNLALVAVLIVICMLFVASTVAYALGINVLNFFVYGTEEYWLIHIQPTGEIGATTLGLRRPFRNYDVWGDAVAGMMASMDMSPNLPTWVPEGYKFESVEDTSLEDFYSELTAHYAYNTNDDFWLIVTRIDPNVVDMVNQIEFEDDKSWIENRKGLSILYSRNFDIFSATWMDEDYQIRIRGTCSAEIIRNMVNSLN